MTFDDLMAVKRVGDPQVSAGGKWVMFSVVDVSLAANTKTNRLWVVSVAGGAERDLGLPAGASNGRFSPDGKWVSYTALGQIWLAAWDEEAGSASVGKQLTSVSTEADGAVWSLDSKRLMFVSSVYPECSDKATWAEEDGCDRAKDEDAAKSKVKAMVFDHLLYRHWNAFTGEKRSHVLVASAASGTDVRDLTPKSAVGDAEAPTFSLGGPLGYAWAPDSKEIAYVANLDEVKAASTNNDVFTLRLDEAGAKAVKVSTSPGSDDGPAYSPDGKWLAFRSQARAGFESDQFRLMLFDRKSETLTNVDMVMKGYAGPPLIVMAGSRPPDASTRPVPPPDHELDRWVDEFLWTSDSQRIFFTASDQDRRSSIERTSPVATFIASVSSQVLKQMANGAA